MLFFYFIVSLFILLIFITIFSTAYELVLKLVTKYEYDKRLLILPSTISIILLYFYAKFYLFSVTNFFKIDIYSTITNSIISSIGTNKEIFRLLLITILHIIGWVIIQSLIFLTINIDYQKIISKIKMVIHIKINENLDEFGLIAKQTEKLKFINSLIASLFLASLVSLIAILLYFSGTLIAQKLIQ